MRQEKPPEAVEHLQSRIDIRHDLTHEGINIHIAFQLFAEVATFDIVLQRFEAVDCGLEVEIHLGMILGTL